MGKGTKKRGERRGGENGREERKGGERKGMKERMGMGEGGVDRSVALKMDLICSCVQWRAWRSRVCLPVLFGGICSLFSSCLELEENSEQRLFEMHRGLCCYSVLLFEGINVILCTGKYQEQHAAPVMYCS